VRASRAEQRRQASSAVGETPVEQLLPEAAVASVAAIAAAAAVAASAPHQTPAPSETPAPLSRRARRAPHTGAQPIPAGDELAAVTSIAEVPAAPATAGAPITAVTPIIPRSAAEAPRVEETEQPASEAVEDTASGIDEFEAAARLFAFTGETPVQPVRAAATPDAGEHVVPRMSRVSRATLVKQVSAACFGVGVMGIVGLLTVGMTTPAVAVAAAGGADVSLTTTVAPGDMDVTVIDEDEIQAYVAPADVENDSLQRAENYTTATVAQMASEAGIQNFSDLYYNDPNSNIQWPFAVGVTMSYGFGMRWGRLHEGIDFTPGNGAPIQAIAEGTVRVASEAGGAYGAHVIIDHMIDGQLVSSHYAHMQYGSMQVKPGDHVVVGQLLGKVGNTGRSYGAHTHFEILMNGTTAIDPMPWLRTYTDGTHTVG
jgi:murein DD-endopeptidase MepM/ murein hydrolase activator NlpD